MYLALRAAFVLLAFLHAVPAQAQGDVVNNGPERLFLAMQGYAAPTLGGAGLSSSFGVRIADVGGANPAALAAFERPTVGLSYQFETSIDGGYFAGIGYGALGNTRPRSAAVAVPVGDWTFGLSYAQRYAAELDFGCIPLQTPDNPEVEAEGFCASQSSRMEAVSPQIAYAATLPSGNRFTVGMRLGFGHGTLDSEINSVESTFSEWGSQVALGMSYRAPGAFGIAGYYESELRIEGELEREVLVPDNPGGPLGGPVTAPLSTVPHSDALPARLGLSIELVASPSARLGVDFARVFWKAAWDGDEQFRDDTDAALWGRLDLSERSLVSFGLLSQGRNRWNNGVDEVFGYSGQAVYLTLGGVLTFDRLRLDAVVADSHLLGADEQQQTVVKVGASVRL